MAGVEGGRPSSPPVVAVKPDDIALVDGDEDDFAEAAGSGRQGPAPASATSQPTVTTRPLYSKFTDAVRQRLPGPTMVRACTRRPSFSWRV